MISSTEGILDLELVHVKATELKRPEVDGPEVARCRAIEIR